MNDIDPISLAGPTSNLEPVHRSGGATMKHKPAEVRESTRGEPDTPSQPNNISKMDFRKIVENVNQFVRHVGTKVTFAFDERINRPVIIVADNENGRVIRTIPPEEMLELMAKLEDVAGLIYHGNV